MNNNSTNTLFNEIQNEYTDILNSEKSKDKYIIFHKEGCIYCKKTFNLLNNSASKFRSFPIENKELFFNSIQHLINNHHTFPVIFFNNKFIGGFNDLMILLNKI